MSERKPLTIIEISADAPPSQPIAGGSGRAPVAVALGNFDGVHLGHQRVIAAAAEAAAAGGWPLGVAMFQPHPRRFFQPQTANFRLQSDHEQDRALAALGVTCRFAIAFNRMVSEMTPEEFVKSILVNAIGARHVAVGRDFRFGHKRQGDVETLTQLGARCGFSVRGVELLEDETRKDTRYSSTAVREALAEGDPQRAGHLLSRPFIIDGIVERGDQRGRVIGFPTANLSLGRLISPRFGVYAVRMQIEGSAEWMDGVANIGVRPTFDGSEPRLEAHLFDRDMDLYGRHVRVALLHFIREERKFSGLDELKAAIARDAQTARDRLGQTAPFSA